MIVNFLMFIIFDLSFKQIFFFFWIHICFDTILITLYNRLYFINLKASNSLLLIILNFNSREIFNFY